jgi:hypothetical protein
MNNYLLQAADIFFLIFHSVLILFNSLGWIWRKTRKLNLITLLLTAGSWFLLGIFYGIGYCPLTDWHFDILRKLGQNNLPYSYIQYITERLTGFSPKPALTELLTVSVLVIALVISIILNYKDFKERKSEKPSG